MATIRDLARSCGVSVATVSRALNMKGPVAEATRRRIVEEAGRIGYHLDPAARQLSVGRSRMLGVVISSFHSLASPILAEVLRGMGEAVESRDYSLLFLSVAARGREAAELGRTLARHRVDGLFFFELSAGQDARRLKDLKVPFLLVNAAAKGVPAVSSANRQGALAAMRHLIGLGHRRIAHLRGPEGSVVAEERFAGYKEALAAAGLPLDPGWVAALDYGDYNAKETKAEEAAVKKLLSLSRPPTALLACTDLMALGAMRAAASLGLSLPKDLSLVGFDDTWAAHCCRPALSTVLQDPEQVGRRAAESLVDAVEATADLRGGPPQKAASFEVATRLLLRGSTAPLSARKTKGK